MSIVQVNGKFQTVDPIVLEDTAMDEDAVSELVERHVQNLQFLKSKDESLLFSQPIVLKNCTIGAEHLELLQTLPKLRMLCLENCTISGGTKLSETYAHIGKQKDSAPIMSKAIQHQEISPAEDVTFDDQEAESLSLEKTATKESPPSSNSVRLTYNELFMLLATRTPLELFTPTSEDYTMYSNSFSEECRNHLQSELKDMGLLPPLGFGGVALFYDTIEITPEQFSRLYAIANPPHAEVELI